MAYHLFRTPPDRRGPLNAEKRLERAVYRRQKDCIRAVYSGERKIFSAE